MAVLWAVSRLFGTNNIRKTGAGNGFPYTSSFFTFIRSSYLSVPAGLTATSSRLIVSPAEYDKGYDVIIMFITSNIKALERPGDYELKEWKEAGLPKASMPRMKLATVDKNIIIKKIARLTEADQKAIQELIIDFFTVYIV